MPSMQNRAPMLTNNTQTFYTDLGLAFGEDSHEKSFWRLIIDIAQKENSGLRFPYNTTELEAYFYCGIESVNGADKEEVERPSSSDRSDKVDSTEFYLKLYLTFNCMRNVDDNRTGAIGTDPHGRRKE